MSYTILVLCCGNIGRSPLVEGLLRRRLADALGVGERKLAEAGVVIRSAGTQAPVGMEPSRRGLALAAERGVDIGGHRSARVTAAMLQDSDRVFCTDSQQVASIATEFGVAAELLDPTGCDIPDPRFEDSAFFEGVRDHIERAISARLPELVSEIRELRLM